MSKESKADIRTLDLRGTGIVTVEGISGDNLVIKVPCKLIEYSAYLDMKTQMEEALAGREHWRNTQIKLADALKMLAEMAGAIQRTGTAWQNLDTDFRPHMDNLKTLLMKYNQWKEGMK